MDFFHMVKTIILTLLVSLAFISCTQNTSSNEIEVKEYTDLPTVIASPKSKMELPEGLKYGKIITPVFPDSMKIENNLLNQVSTYNSALIHGDINTCGKYLYPDAFEYCKKYYPNFPDEEIMKEFFKNMSGDMQKALKIWEKNGVEFKIIVYNLEKKIIYNNDVIIVFNVTSNICSDDVYIHYTGLEKTIGISQNGGTNFWFMKNHEDLPTILSMHYPQNVINAVMGY